MSPEAFTALVKPHLYAPVKPSQEPWPILASMSLIFAVIAVGIFPLLGHVDSHQKEVAAWLGVKDPAGAMVLMVLACLVSGICGAVCACAAWLRGESWIPIQVAGGLLSVGALSWMSFQLALFFGLLH